MITTGPARSTWDKKYREMTELLSATFVPVLTEVLIAEGTVSRRKLSDPDYMYFVLQTNQCIIRRIIGRARLLITIGDDVTETFNISAAAGRQLAAVLFLATAVEHIINYFYNDVLSQDMEEDRASIVSTPFAEKLGWVLLMLTPRVLPQDVVRDLETIIRLKNAISSRKMMQNSGRPGSNDELDSKIKSLDLTDMLQLASRMHDVLIVQSQMVRRERIMRRSCQSFDMGLFSASKYYAAASVASFPM
jgi:hypothetical protein